MSTSLDPTVTSRWRSTRRPLLVVALVLGTALVMALVTGTTSSPRLDPRAANPDGGRALAQLLEDQGIQVLRRTTTAGVVTAVGAGTGTTLLVNDPGLLVEEQVTSLRATGADLVVVAPEQPERFAPGVRVAAVVPIELRRPRCALPAPRRAGSADMGGFAFGQGDGGFGLVRCYGTDEGATLVQAEQGSRSVTLLGSSVTLTNRHLDESGNAALALGLLGQNERLVWYLPSLSDVPPDAAQASFFDLVPDAIGWAALQLAVAALLLAWWRARRLGPVVVEPLPVVVRASETTEGRARLYRRAAARDTAADILRAAARARLIPAVGLPSGCSPAALVQAVQSRSARPRAEVTALLYGATPADDRALVQLADALDFLEKEVRRP